MRNLVIVASILVAQLATAPGQTAAAQPSKAAAGDRMQLAISPDGISLEDLVSLWSTTTGRKLIYNESDLKGRSKVQFKGMVDVKRSDGDWFFQSVILANGFALMPMGPVESDTWALEFIQNSSGLRQLARYVPSGDLGAVARRPAEVFTTTFQLQHVGAAQVHRVLSQLLTTRAAELVDMSSPRTLVVVGFGPTLAMVSEIVRATDRPENVISESRPADDETKPREKR